MNLKKHELRIFLSKNLHEHISKEATKRYTSMSAVAREILATNLLSQEKRTYSAMPPTQIQNNPPHNTVSTSTQRSEKRLSSAINRVEKLLAFTESRLQMLIVMVNNFYLDLMMHIPNIPEEMRPAATAMAKLRHSQWLKKIGVTDSDNQKN